MAAHLVEPRTTRGGASRSRPGTPLTFPSTMAAHGDRNPNRSVHVGAGLPMAFDDPAGDAQALAGTAERLGYDSVWLADHGLGYRRGEQAGSLDPLAVLAYLAAVTERVALGISVILLPLRIPVQLAQTLATVDQLSGGRVIAGLGLGRNDATRAAVGAPPTGVVARHEEAVAVLRAAWSPGPLAHRGESWTIDGVDVQPKPVRGGIPIWFGGNSDAAIDRAARLGDGWMGAGSAPWAAIPQTLESVHAALERHGRDPAGFTIGKRVYYVAETDRQRALHRMRDEFATVYGRAEMAGTVAITGSVDQLLDEVSRLVELGCTFLMLHPVYDVAEQLAVAAEHLLPALRER